MFDIRAVGICLDKDRDPFGCRSLAAQLPGCDSHESGNRFLQLGESGDRRSKRARSADLFPDLIFRVAFHTGYPVKFLPGTHPDDIDQPSGFFPCKVCEIYRSPDTDLTQTGGEPATDSPDFIYLGQLKRLAPASLVINKAHSPVTGIFLRKTGRNFRQGLRRGHTERCRNPHIAAHTANDFPRRSLNSRNVCNRKRNERFVYGIDFDIGHHAFDGSHYTGG